MHRKSNARWLLISLILVFCVPGEFGRTEAQSVDPGQIVNEPPSKAVRDLERKQAKAANQKRFQDLKRDTNKLLQLATELKAAVDKANENTLSVEVIKKAEEIEKLSHDVQKKMRN